MTINPGSDRSSGGRFKLGWFPPTQEELCDLIQDTSVIPDNGDIAISGITKVIAMNPGECPKIMELPLDILDPADLISADIPNTLGLGTDGKLLVTPQVVFDNQDITMIDTATIDGTLIPSAPTGTDNQVNYTFEANVKVSAAANNDVTINPDGLFIATPIAVTVADTDTVDLTETTVGLVKTIGANVKISATVGNTIVANTDGIFVPPAPAETITTITNTVVGNKIADYTAENSTVTAIN
jgi:hypothetical protein